MSSVEPWSANGSPMSWQRRHPSEIPRALWLEWLASDTEPSPYLLPEWGLFWESVWPRSRAELWIQTDAGGRVWTAVPLTRRRRLGWEMCYAQPLGTPCGPLYPGGRSANDVLAEDVLFVAVGHRTVEIACDPVLAGGPQGRWRKEVLRVQTWLLRVGRDSGEHHRGYSESHRRNIRRGEGLSPRLSPLETEADVRRLMTSWVDRSHPSRFVLDPVYAQALIRGFAPTGALRFRAAWIGSQPVAAVIFLVHRAVAVYVDGAFDREPRFRGVGHLLFAETLDSLRTEGVRLVDLGGGPTGTNAAGLERFKQGWGSMPEERTTLVYRRPWYHAVRPLFRSER